jgi:hypothetical protein
MTPPPITFCACDPMCDVCLAQRLSWVKGIAQARGENWARAVARVVPIDQPWPMTERMHAIARRKMDDLASDPRLLELLTDEVIEGAARWWNRALEHAG